METCAQPPRLAFLALLLAAWPLLGGCAGYQFGHDSLYPTHIHTVYVPVFGSSSFRRNLGERLTEAVQKQIELKTPYKVVGTPQADSTLSGRIVGETKHLVVQSIEGDPRVVELNLAVEVSWVDHSGRTIRDCPTIPLPSELVNVSAASDLVPEIGQSMAVAHQQAVVELAEQIVSLMEAPW